MALHSSNGLTYFLSVAVEHKEYLGAIRSWSNLKIAFGDDLVWVKDLTSVQMDSIEVKSIPFKELYYSSGRKLFLQGSLLPDRNIPSLLWTPIERGLPIKLPAFNHNYFGLPNKVTIRLVPSDAEREAYGLMVTIELLKLYIERAPAIRMKNLIWTIVDDDKALILGTPLLPLQGEVFWRKDDFLFPTGYELELSALFDTLNTLVNAESNYCIVWDKEGAYWKVHKDLLKPLSISSFHLSLKG